MDDQDARAGLLLENQETEALGEFEVVNGEVHLPAGKYILRSALPNAAIYQTETILI